MGTRRRMPVASARARAHASAGVGCPLRSKSSSSRGPRQGYAHLQTTKGGREGGSRVALSLSLSFTPYQPPTTGPCRSPIPPTTTRPDETNLPCCSHGATRRPQLMVVGGPAGPSGCHRNGISAAQRADPRTSRTTRRPPLAARPRRPAGAAPRQAACGARAACSLPPAGTP